MYILLKSDLLAGKIRMKWGLFANGCWFLGGVMKMF